MRSVPVVMCGLLMLAVGIATAVGGESAVDARTHWEMIGEVADKNGKPMAGVEVLAVGERGTFRQEGMTDGQGIFRLRVPHSTPVILIRAREKGGQRGAYLSIGRFQTMPDVPISLSLRPVYEGIVLVVDEAGRPVEGAAVRVVQSGFPVTEGVTKKDGMARVEMIFPDKRSSGSIQVLKAGVGYGFCSTQDLYGDLNLDSFVSTMKLTLKKPRTVRLKVIDGEKKPVAGVDVELTQLMVRGNRSKPTVDRMPQKFSKTNGEGIAVFDWIPVEVVEGVVFVRPGGEEFTTVDDGKVTLRPGDEETVVRFARKMRVAGRVLLPDGKPAGRVKVSIQTTSSTRADLREILETTEEGRFELRVPANRACQIFAESGNLLAQKTDLVLLEGKPIEDVELRLVPGQMITGRCSRGESKQRAVGETIQLARKGELLPKAIQKLNKGFPVNFTVQKFDWVTQTDEKGEYRFFALPGEYVVHHVFSADDSFAISVGETPQSLRDFHSPYEMIALEGSVVDQEGKPVDGAVIEKVYAPQETPRISRKKMFTSVDGSFGGERLNAPVAILIQSPDKKLALVSRVEAGEKRRFELQPLSAIRGRLVNEDGEPSKNIRVQFTGLLLDQDKEAHLSTMMGFSQTDGEGRFEVRGLATGADWRFSFEFKPQSFVMLRDVSLIEPGDLDLGELVLPKK